MRFILLFLLFSSCRTTKKPCRELEARFNSCTKNAPAAKDLGLHCEVAMATPAEPADAAPSLGEIERRVFVDCLPTLSCAELSGCLAGHGCQFLLTGPDDHEPKLWCSGG